MMKRSAAFIFALLLFALCGCTSAENAPTTAISTTAESSTIQSTLVTTSVSTSATTAVLTQQSTTESTTITSTEPQPHVHSYTSSVIKKATCTADGTRKYTCSCGESYTESIQAKGHKWGQWLQIMSGSQLAPSGKYRICATCKTEERSVNYGTMLKTYVTLVGFLNRSYTSPSQISAEEVAKALPMVLSVSPTLGQDGVTATRTYPVKDLNQCAMNCFGRTFDFTGVKNVSVYGYGTISYDANQNALVWTFPYGQDHDWHKTVFEKYATADNDTKFQVKYHYEYTNGSVSDTYSFIVTLQNGNYVITSVTQS